MEVKISPIQILYDFEGLKINDYFITKYGYENHNPPSIFQKIDHKEYRDIINHYIFKIDSLFTKNLYKVNIDSISLSIVV